VADYNIHSSALDALLQVDNVVEQNSLTIKVSSIFPIVYLGYRAILAVQPMLMPLALAGNLEVTTELKERLGNVERSVIEVDSISSANDERGVTLVQPHSPTRGSRFSFFTSESTRAMSHSPSQSMAGGGHAGDAPEAEAENVHDTTFKCSRLDVARGRLCYDILRLRYKLSHGYKHYHWVTNWSSFVVRHFALPSLVTSLRHWGWRVLDEHFQIMDFVRRWGVLELAQKMGVAPLASSASAVSNAIAASLGHWQTRAFKLIEKDSLVRGISRMLPKESIAFAVAASASFIKSLVAVESLKVTLGYIFPPLWSGLWRILFGVSAKRARLTGGSAEYEHILRDVLNLEDKDADPRIKLSIITKLRTSYSCFR